MATTIQIQDNIWKQLNSLKRTGETFQEVLERIFKMIKKFKLKKELELIEEKKQ